MYNTACTHADIYTDVNRPVDNSEPLLPLLEDATAVKYRRLKNVPLKILCLSVFMIERAGCSSVSLKLRRRCSHDVYSYTSKPSRNMYTSLVSS